MESKKQTISREVEIISHQLTKEENYWLNQLSGNLAKSTFPCDYPKTIEAKSVTSSIQFRLTGEIFSLLIKLSNRSHPRMHMILTAALVALLHKYNHNKDIIIGTPIYKQEIDTAFINTILALRNPLEDHMTFKDLLLQVRETITRADEHQNYPINVLVQKLNIPDTQHEFPLFDTALLLENIQYKKYLEGIHLNLIFSFLNTPGGIQGNIEYNSSLYKESTIKRIANHFTRLLEKILHKIDIQVVDIDILTQQEKHQLLIEFNNTDAAYPIDKTIHRSIAEQVVKFPDNTAIVGQKPLNTASKPGPEPLPDTLTPIHVTYKELNKKSNQLARILKKNSVTTGTVVGIMMEHSPDMVVALLAVLKTGAAYLPIDPGMPRERVLHMLKDSSAPVLLVDNGFIEGITFTALQGFEDNNNISIQITPPRLPIKDFNRLPIPDRSHINLNNYKNKIGMASVTNCISIQTTRGCPYECLYCHKIWSKKHVHRSAGNIFAEIQYFYENGVSNFAVIDDCFNLSSQESRRLFQLIIKNKLQIQLFFPNGLRGDILTPDYIDLMVEAGTCGINLSLETASPRLQKLLKKNLDLDKFKQVFDYIAKTHPNIILEMATMHGFPSETEEEAMTTLNFIKDIKWLHFPYIHILKIFPNTEMEAFALEHGISKEHIMASRDRAFHELPETLPFSKSFTRKYQASFLNEYFLSKERLNHVLPVQMKILSEQALAQKYNAYLPTEIKGIHDVIDFAGLEGFEIPGNNNHQEKQKESIFDYIPATPRVLPAARRILFLDLSQHFSSHQMLYRVVEQPLGEIYLLTYLKQRFGNQIDGRIYKSGNDFDAFEELKNLIKDYKPQLIGIRTLTFFKEFFHETAALIRQWGIDAPIIAGGPYASSDYDTLLKDKNIQLVVLGEGEHSLGELIEKMLNNDFQLPGTHVLEQIKGIAFVRDFSRYTSRQVISIEQIASTMAEQDSRDLEPATKGNHLAYVMYTSGSTGKPKGVMVEHRQVKNCLYWMQDKFQLTERDVVLQRTNLTFDPSVWEIFWPLSVGGSVKLLTRQQGRDPEYLIGLMSEAANATIMYCPASLLVGMSYLLNKKKTGARLKLPWLIIGAEPINMEVIKIFYTYFEGKIVNTYGPTEATINNTYYQLDPGDHRSIVPIGKPIANNKIYILSPGMQLVPVMVKGEIYIAGHSIARGYINNRESQKNHFIDNHFQNNQGKLYKTGDIGRWLEDGNIEIMGRTDDQVKIRGYRIEPAEIKSALLTHRSIVDCAVVVKDMGSSREDRDTPGACKKCGITTAYPGVTIDEDGICGICCNLSHYIKILDHYFMTTEQLKQSILQANKDKTGNYDCLLLYAGGRGAAYALYRLKDMGFNVLAATYDNGFMGKTNMDNIKMILAKLNVDHVVLTHKNTQALLRESIKRADTVCRGCFLTSSSLAAQYALENNIKVVVGATLSRGQIIDNKLFIFLQQGITDEKELENQVLIFQENTRKMEKHFFELIDINGINNDSVHEQVKFLDFYRYCDISNQDMIDYLNNRDPYWKNRKNHAVYSTNCPIKQLGDYAHMKKNRYHFYGSATSWERRLEHLTLKNVKEDLECGVTQKGFENFLKKIKYPPEQQIKKEDKYLCAYYVVDNTLPGEGPSTPELSNYLLKRLPKYMIPGYFMQLDRIPLTPNGKLDRKSLPYPKITRSQLSTSFVAPRTSMEILLVNLWKDVLQLDQVGINDNFFDVGGNSLNIIEVSSKLQEAINRDIPIVTLFTYSTIGALAKNIRQEENQENLSKKKQQKTQKLNISKSKMKRAVQKIREK